MHKIIYIFLMFLMVSCAPKIKNFDKYQKQFLSKTQFLPTDDQITGKTPKIAVFQFDDNSNEVAIQANLGKSIANNVENILTKNKLAKLVDRSVASKLEKEIKLSEANKTGSYKGPQIVDFAISGAISNASFSKKYNSASTYVNPKTGALVSKPASFTYQSEVGGNIKIYEIPSMTVLDNIEFSGEAVRNENVQKQGGFSLGYLSIGAEESQGINRDDGLARKAAEMAINQVEIELKNALSQRGYILEKRTFEDKVIFKISLGSTHGLKNGDEFKIMGKYEAKNEITNKSEVETRVIAEGKISNIIDPKTCWVVLDKKEYNSKVRLGDVVKMNYQRGFLDSLAKKY